jgi:N-acetylglucosaminyldiphosphoundecaprenol N-acetyl-beta-D-mannosaminyltransferase
MKAAFRQCRILKTDIHETTLALACQAIIEKVSYLRSSAIEKTAQQGMVSSAEYQGGAFVCLTNVHMLMEAHDDERFNQLLARAFLVLADGKPLAMAQQLLGFSHGEQIRGYSLFLALLAKAAELKLRVGFYGGQDEALLASLVDETTKRWPHLQVVYRYAPPFRPLSEHEDRQQCALITQANVDLLFVGLGCPKQEHWMDQHPEIQAVQIGVGAVFDFVAGRKPQAPFWMQQYALEWLFRWWQEPKRLTSRYLRHNPRFIFYFISQWFQLKMGKTSNKV